MTKYEFLLELQASGTLKTLIKEFGLAPHFVSWMEIYAYHLEHSKLSQFLVSKKFSISKAKVWDVYQFMNQTLPPNLHFSTAR